MSARLRRKAEDDGATEQTLSSGWSSLDDQVLIAFARTEIIRAGYEGWMQNDPCVNSDRHRIHGHQVCGLIRLASGLPAASSVLLLDQVCLYPPLSSHPHLYRRNLLLTLKLHAHIDHLTAPMDDEIEMFINTIESRCGWGRGRWRKKWGRGEGG